MQPTETEHPMWIEKRGQQHRVYWRTGLPSPTKSYEKFDTRAKAEGFRDVARLAGLQPARDYLATGDPAVLHAALGLSPRANPVTTAGQPLVSTADDRGPTVQRHPHAVGLTFAELWARFLAAQRHLEEGTAEDYESYGKHHLLPFFGPHDLGLIHRTRPLRARDEAVGAVYVDDWVAHMLAKERLDRMGRRCPARC